jgi:DNA-binding NarL/FixJ family response regulator
MMVHTGKLTERQQLVLQMLAEGWTNQKIARELDREVQSVDNIIGRIYDVLGLPDKSNEYNPRILAARWYWTKNL